MPEHSSLKTERWAKFTRTQQIIQVACEMQRGSNRTECNDRVNLKHCYERALRLAELTIAVSDDASLQRQLSDWREEIAALSMHEKPDASAHRNLYRILLLLDPEASKQIEYLGL